MNRNSGDGGGRARACDSCQSAACRVYCRADSAYLCVGCDSCIHAANWVASRHERVWVCEACESAAATITCKADAAALCAACDADIHSANPLARRHHRVPILPIPGHLFGVSQPGIRPVYHGDDVSGDGFAGEEEVGPQVEDEAASWLLLNPGKNREVDYLDLVEYNSCGENNNNNNQYRDHHQYSHQQKQNNGKNDRSDSVVPVLCGGNEHLQQLQQQQLLQQQKEMEYEGSKSGFNYTGSLSQSVSLSPMEASIVPDFTMTDISKPHTRPPRGTIELFSGPPLQMPHQFTPLDREASVLRYREKKKTRKFQKTIRYASRKAYAETRPRIKGRFAKRTDVEFEVDQMFNAMPWLKAGTGLYHLSYSDKASPYESSMS